MSFLTKLFDLRSLLPRERRRRSHRETAKGVTGGEAGRPLSESRAKKYARRRCERRAMTNAIVIGLSENPAGSKRMRRYAKVAGYVVEDEGGTLRKPTAVECFGWYRALEIKPRKTGEAAVRVMG